MKKLFFLLMLYAIGCSMPPARRVTPLELTREAAKTSLTGSTQQIFRVEGFTMVVREQEVIRQMIEKRLGITNAMGLFDPKTRTIYVPYSTNFDRFNRRMPDTETVGHEVLHFPEILGAWHTNPPPNLPGWTKPK